MIARFTWEKKVFGGREFDLSSLPSGKCFVCYNSKCHFHHPTVQTYTHTHTFKSPTCKQEINFDEHEIFFWEKNKIKTREISTVFIIKTADPFLLEFHSLTLKWNLMISYNLLCSIDGNNAPPSIFPLMDHIRCFCPWLISFSPPTRETKKGGIRMASLVPRCQGPVMAGTIGYSQPHFLLRGL